jgi:triosephosphate isomerase (TIM)
MILINFKIYKETFGNKAIDLAKVIKEVSDKSKVRMVIAASALEAVRIKQETGVEVWLQNVDEYTEGKHTGAVSMEQAMALGINGSLLNHSEHKIAKGTALKIIKNRPKGFEIALCVASIGQIEKWGARAKPDWIFYEPPELIASKDRSVATEESKVIKNAVEKAEKVPIMVGAGIKNKNDVEISLKMGAKAVGLSSALVLAANPKELLEGLVAGFISV